MDDLTRAEAAAAIGLTPRILARLAESKNGPPYYQLSRKAILYPRDELFRWKQECLRMAPRAAEPAGSAASP